MARVEFFNCNKKENILISINDLIILQVMASSKTTKCRHSRPPNHTAAASGMVIWLQL
jgi:hypothetical protein